MQYFMVMWMTCNILTDTSTKKNPPCTQPMTGKFLLIISQLKWCRCIYGLGVSYYGQVHQSTHRFHMRSTQYSLYLCSLVTSRFYWWFIMNIRGHKNSTCFQLRVPGPPSKFHCEALALKLFLVIFHDLTQHNTNPSVMYVHD